MYECSAIWHGKTRFDEAPLDKWCRCIRQWKYDGAHRCSCEPIDFFIMSYASEDD